MTEQAVREISEDAAPTARWVDEHGDALFAYALSRVGCPHQAEDLVQECFLAALQASQSFNGQSELRTWLVGILRHKMIDYFRRTNRSKEVQEPRLGPCEGLMGLFDKHGRWNPGPRRWNRTPAELYESREFLAVYEKCRSVLPTTLAEAYTLRELEGLAAAQVCDILGISANNLAVRLHRARLCLRDCLEKHWFAD